MFAFGEASLQSVPILAVSNISEEDGEAQSGPGATGLTSCLLALSWIERS